MCRNIAIFGPTSSGKSTLMGYLQSHDMSKEEREKLFRKTIKEIEKEDLKYHPDRKLAYLVDKSVDERRDDVNQKYSKKGSSVRIHFCKAMVEEEECSFIETPGSDQYWIEKNEGVFLGDIGIYIVEMKNLRALFQKVESSISYKKLERKIFSPIYFWKHYKNLSQLIIVLSKIDIDYSDFAIEKAIELLHSFQEFKNIPVVPISIDVYNVTDCNIYKESALKKTFYKGKTLIEELHSLIIRKSDTADNNHLLFGHIHKMCEVKKENLKIDHALRIKLLSGEIISGMKVGIGPLKNKETKQSIYAEGIVKSVNHEMLGPVQNLNKGEVGGIIFSKFIVDGQERKETDYSVKRTSVIYDIDARQKKGNLIYLSIDLKSENEKMKEAFFNLNLNDRIKLVWFGKIIAMDFIGRQFYKEEFKIILTNYNSSTDVSEFFLTMNENRELIFEKFVIQLPNDYFMGARITDIDSISEHDLCQLELSYETDDFIVCFKEYIETIAFGYAIEYGENNVIFIRDVSNKNITFLMSTLRKFIKKYGFLKYQIDITKQ